jgi:DNA topoisomerase-1
MSLAQQLYEGVPLGSEGSVGLITYMRTDSVHVSSGAVHETREYVKQKYGEEFLPKNVRTFTRKSVGAQEAHEAIRPTAIARTPESVARYLSRDQARLYELIWERMVASQMASAISDATMVDIDAHCHGDGKTFVFRAAGSVLRFHGFRILYLEGKDDTTEDSEESEVVLPPLKEKEQLLCLGLNPEQRFTQPPPRYSEATLIRALEEKGIGRPSTYATIISTLFERGYVVSEQRRLVPTILGKSVCNLLKDRFPSVMDIEFTARMEQDLDRIAQGETKWVPVIAEFYTPFQKALVAAENIPPVRIPKPPPKPTNELCPQCGKPLVIRNGRFGEFIACSGFPSCRFTKPLVKDTGIKCPKCGEGVVVERRSSKKGRVFYGCSKYPNCDFVTNRKPLPQKCPECGGMLVSQGRNSAQCTKCAYRGPAPEEDSQLAEVSETQ